MFILLAAAFFSNLYDHHLVTKMPLFLLLSIFTLVSIIYYKLLFIITATILQKIEKENIVMPKTNYDRPFSPAARTGSPTFQQQGINLIYFYCLCHLSLNLNSPEPRSFVQQIDPWCIFAIHLQINPQAPIIFIPNNSVSPLVFLAISEFLVEWYSGTLFCLVCCFPSVQQ